jgi:hypothetical protein
MVPAKAQLFLLMLSFAGGFIGCSSRSRYSAEDEPSSRAYIAEVTAKSFSDLVSKIHPDLEWRSISGDASDSATFFWITKNAKSSGYVISLEEAYFIPNKGNGYWEVSASGSRHGGQFDYPPDFKREILNTRDTSVADGNHSYAKVLDSNPDGGTIIKVVYCSLNGAGAHQEAILSWLIYIAPNGKASLATEDLGHEGAYPHNEIGRGDENIFHISWGRGAISTLENTVSFVKMKYESISNPDMAFPDYAKAPYVRCRDGAFVGAFPCKQKLEPFSYIVSDGILSLREVALRIAWYEDPNHLNPYVPGKVDACVNRLLFLNPELTAASIPAQGIHIKCDNDFTLAATR